jgi:tRNA pseudouridine55 synthase
MVLWQSRSGWLALKFRMDSAIRLDTRIANYRSALYNAVMDGVIVIDKPAGLTSHDVVARVRRILHERRVGHTGTLDPFATGVLVIMVGRATRLAQFLSGAEKEYEAMVRLGFATDTGDLTGTPRSEDRIVYDPSPSNTAEVDTQVRPCMGFSDQEIESAMAHLRGEIEQVPPMYSAKKHQGQKLYEMARRGEQIERKAVRITVSAFEAVPVAGQWLIKNSDGSRDLTVRVVCSAGTYVRTLAEDFGKRLGVGAHLAALRRTRAGDFPIARGLTVDQLQEKTETGELASILLTPDAALAHLPFVDLGAEDARRARNGMEIRLNDQPNTDWPDEQQVRMRAGSGQLIAVGAFDRLACRLRPRVVVDVEK